jgi:hypothetical protein
MVESRHDAASDPDEDINSTRGSEFEIQIVKRYDI